MKDYRDYKKFELPSLDDFYSLNLEKYYIYLTNDKCPECEEIKQDIFSYFESDLSPKMYFFNMKSFGTEEGNLNRSKFQDHNEYSSIYNINEMLKNHPSTLKETYFCCTPSIYVIKNKQLDKFYYTKEDILNLIEK